MGMGPSVISLEFFMVKPYNSNGELQINDKFVTNGQIPNNHFIFMHDKCDEFKLLGFSDEFLKESFGLF